jgi:NCAIR mutase (PurE)-related protein
MMMIIASMAVALVSFIVYALERRSKQEPIVWEDALKLSLFSGVITSGVVFASTADVPVITETAAVVSEVAQDMFVGSPSF